MLAGGGGYLPPAPPGCGGRPPRDEHFTTGAPRERTPRPNRDEILARRRAFADGALVRYRIEVGRNQGASPKEIVGAIANEGGIEGRFIGQIHLFDDFSTVELPANLPAELMDTLKRTRVRQMQLNIRALSAAEAAATPERRRPPRDDGGWRDNKQERKPGGFERRESRPTGGYPKGDWKARERSSDGQQRQDHGPSRPDAGGHHRNFSRPADTPRPASHGAGKPRKRRES